MEYSEFLGDVKHRLELDSRQAALRVTRVTQETLGERLGRGVREPGRRGGGRRFDGVTEPMDRFGGARPVR